MAAPMEMQPGMDLDPQVWLAVMRDKVAAAAIRETQLETAVQQLLSENAELRGYIESRAGEAAPDERAAPQPIVVGGVPHDPYPYPMEAPHAHPSGP